MRSGRFGFRDGNCYRCGEFHPDCSPCHQSPEDAALDRKQVLDAYRGNMEEISEPCDEPRASVMPACVKAIDPLFYDAAFRPFTPAEKVMVEEKELVERARRAGL